MNIDTSTKPHESILAEAERITDGDRNIQYGDANIDFKRTAIFWSEIVGTPITATQVALMMVALKISRACHNPKRDNWVDMAGYAKCGYRCAVEQKQINNLDVQ